MNTDRERLEAAAKAAGYWSQEFNCPANLPSLTWDPLTDDGDALRLAVKLGIDVSHNTFGNVIADHYALQDKRAVVLAHGIDPCAATRRAIVSLAAKMSPLPAVGAA